MKRPFLGKHYSRLSSFHDYLQEPMRAAARQSIMEEIINQAPLHAIVCPCGHSDSDILLTEIDRWGLPCCQVLCGKCGMLRVSPRWDDNIYSLIYAQYFWPLQAGNNEISEKRFELSVKRAYPYVDYLSKHFDFKNKRVLELGCSYGAGLVPLKSKGATLVGYDWDNRILEIGRNLSGLDLRYGGSEEAIEQLTDLYDLVILRHVFEHVLDPFSEARRLRELLKQSGLLFIEVPGVLNADEWSPDPMAFFNVFHVYSYYLRTLSCVMARSGFELVCGDEHVYSLWRKSDVSRVSAWENRIEAADILNFIKRIERIRKWRQLLPGQVMRKVWAAAGLR